MQKHTDRDLRDYQEQYVNQPYEKHQVAFRKRKIIEVLEKHDHHRLLEVGCGLESIFLNISSFEHLTIIEPAETFYLKALEDIRNTSNQNITVINGLLEDKETLLKKSHFNFILVSSLLHEISDQGKFLRALHAISNDNTITHVNVPNAKSFHRLLAVEMGLIKNEYEMSSSNLQFQQQRVFDLPLLIELVESNGFKVLDAGAYSLKPFTHLQMQNMINSHIISENMLEGFYNMEKYLPGLGSEIFVNIKKN